MSQTKTKPSPPRKPRKPVPGSLPAVTLEVLTLAEAAAYLRVSEDEVEELATRGEFPGRVIRGQWRFLKAAVQDWLRSAPSQKENLMQVAGAWKDDPYLDEMLEKIYKDRGRPMIEEQES